MTKGSTVVTMRLSREDLKRIELLRALENIDRTTLLREFIQDGLRRKVIQIYKNGRITASRAAEILRISLREFLEMLEREGVPVSWDSENIRKYLESKYGE